MSPIVQVTLFTKPDCCLCRTAHLMLQRIGARMPLEVKEVDISTDAELLGRYGEHIPVVLVEGEEAARGRLVESRIRNVIERKSLAGQR